MSYSLDDKCYNCTLKAECLDRHVISGAIQTIHSFPFGVGHKGAGVIVLDCGNKVTDVTE
jgi:Zn-dependent alcohol dehydrogenase